MVLEVDPVKRRISLGLKQTLRQSVGGLRRAAPGRLDRRGRGQEQDRVRPVHRPRRRRRRHGPPLRPRLEPAGRAGDRGLQPQGDMVKARCSTSTSRRSASRSASSSSAAIRSRDGRASSSKGAVVTCEVIEVKDGGIEVKIADTDLTAFIRRADLARDRADQRPERFAVGEKVDARVTSSTRRPASHGLDQGARDRRGEGSGRPVRLVRLRRLARRHPRRGAQAPATRSRPRASAFPQLRARAGRPARVFRAPRPSRTDAISTIGGSPPSSLLIADVANQGRSGQLIRAAASTEADSIRRGAAVQTRAARTGRSG